MFTTPCFIRKNTPELWKVLETLGYQQSRCIDRDSYLCIATSVFKEYSKYTTITREMFDTKNPYITWNCAGRVDCGTNEELFLAIAALRDDSDKNQWFIYDTTDCIIESRRRVDWLICEEDKIEDFLFYDCEFLNVHKATVEELIEHFKLK